MGEKKFITDSKEVMRKIHDASYTTSDLIRAQKSMRVLTIKIQAEDSAILIQL